MKKIDHFYKNLSIDKLIDVLNSWEPDSPGGMAHELTKCVKGYNNSNDEADYFELYLWELLLSGEFFLNLKEYFTINSYYRNEINEKMWNMSYVLYCKKDKKHRLINNEACGSVANDIFSILDTISDRDLKKIQKTFRYPPIEFDSPTSHLHSYHMSILDGFIEKNYDSLFADKDQEDFFTKPKKPYYFICGNFNLDKEDREDNKEAIELEHVDVAPNPSTPDDSTPDDSTPDEETKSNPWIGLVVLLVGLFMLGKFAIRNEWFQNNQNSNLGQQSLAQEEREKSEKIIESLKESLMKQEK
jgi:hypothetical protein